ncbi:hypothetical protein B0H14DRAFT_3701256 [Mycena olivaceomarginata]|nr:hypothetical protein B0H14DRAFT_3701256 [Mycena olivaceomarginata]
MSHGPAPSRTGSLLDSQVPTFHNTQVRAARPWAVSQCNLRLTSFNFDEKVELRAEHSVEDGLAAETQHRRGNGPRGRTRTPSKKKSLCISHGPAPSRTGSPLTYISSETCGWSVACNAQMCQSQKHNKKGTGTKRENQNHPDRTTFPSPIAQPELRTALLPIYFLIWAATVERRMTIWPSPESNGLPSQLHKLDIRQAPYATGHGEAENGTPPKKKKKTSANMVWPSPESNGLPLNSSRENAARSRRGDIGMQTHITIRWDGGSWIERNSQTDMDMDMQKTTAQEIAQHRVERAPSEMIEGKWSKGAPRAAGPHPGTVCAWEGKTKNELSKIIQGQFSKWPEDTFNLSKIRRETLVKGILANGFSLRVETDASAGENAGPSVPTPEVDADKDSPEPSTAPTQLRSLDLLIEDLRDQPASKFIQDIQVESEADLETGRVACKYQGYALCLAEITVVFKRENSIEDPVEAGWKRYFVKISGTEKLEDGKTSVQLKIPSSSRLKIFVEASEIVFRLLSTFASANGLTLRQMCCKVIRNWTRLDPRGSELQIRCGGRCMAPKFVVRASRLCSVQRKNQNKKLSNKDRVLFWDFAANFSAQYFNKPSAAPVNIFKRTLQR